MKKAKRAVQTDLMGDIKKEQLLACLVIKGVILSSLLSCLFGKQVSRHGHNFL